MSQRVGRARYFARKLWINGEMLWGNMTWRMCVVQNVLDMAARLGDKAAVGQEEIQDRLDQLVQHWDQLKELTKAR